MKTFHKLTKIGASREALAQWHEAPGAFERLTPPWERVEIESSPERIEDGARAVIAMKLGPFRKRWVAIHEDCRSGEGFTDVQSSGPFAHWRHEHRFHECGDHGSELEDRISYQLPLGWLGDLVAGKWVQRQLARTFRYRHAITRADLERQRMEPSSGEPSRTILMTGASGMVGSALTAYLRMRGFRVLRVTRHPRTGDDLRWDPGAGELELDPDARIDGVVHLAGENIAGGRWTEARRKRIMESRRLGTRLLCQRLAALPHPPRVLVSASGVNIYRAGADRPSDEDGPHGEGFLTKVCQAWEEETHVAKEAGIRVVNYRLGIVLSPAGGALGKMLLPFQCGLGGVLGSGRQKMPWIAIDDVVDLMHRALVDEAYSGPINAVAPQIVENRAFTQALARTLKRPAFLPAPAAFLKLVLGRSMAEETLLVDLKVTPGKLEALKYPFRYAEIEGALRHLLGRALEGSPGGHQ